MATMKENADIAEETARAAVSDMTDVNRDRGRSEEGHGSMFQSVADALGQAKDAVTENIGSAASFAKDAVVRRAGDHPAEADHLKEKYTGTEFEARRKMEELKLKEEGRDDEEKKREEARKETAADRGTAATKTIYGAMGSVTAALKEKSKMPTDIVEEARALREHGVPGIPERGGGYSRSDVEDVV